MTLRRSPIRRHPRRDPVSPETAAAVFARDQGCVAPRLGGSILDCFGARRIEHVKREPRMGLRAESQVERLVEICDGHSEPGMRQGFVWCTARQNREAMRAYLRAIYEDRCTHVEPVHGCPSCMGRAVA